jgi:arylsulfatase A-like enzyme
MTRLGLLLSALVTAIVVGALAGALDATTTRHAFLDRSFLAISILAWMICLLAVAIPAGLLAGAAVDPARDRGRRSPARFAALLAAGAASGALAFQALVWVNVEKLASDRSPAALAADGLLAVAAIGATLLLARLLEPAFLPGRRLRTGGAAVALAVLGVAVVAVTWRGGVGDVDPPTTVPPDDAPNIALVLIDTLRRDHLSVEGYDRPTTPALEDFAARGARFSALVSTSCYTKPAVASLLTSLYPSGHRVGHLRTVLAEDRTTLAEVFHAAGWRTGKFVANTIIGPEFGFAQGSERFSALPSERIPKTKLGYALVRLSEPGRAIPGVPGLAGVLRRMERALLGTQGANVLADKAPVVIESFERWRDSVDGDPWFAYLHFMEPHAPYRPPEEVTEPFADPAEPFVADHPPTAGVFLPFSRAAAVSEAERNGLIRAYDAEIAGLDRRLGELLERFRREEAAGGRPTIVAITSDHGEEFYEHGGWGHGQSLHAEQLRVPFLLGGRGVPEGITVDRRVQLVDVAPTLLELAGAPVPGEMRGHSLVPLLEEPPPDGSGPSDGPPRVELAEIVYGDAYWSRALRSGRWKLIVARLGEEESVQLYDVETDPDETRDLAAERPEDVAALRALLDAEVAAAAAGAGETITAEFDPVTEERLRALGYLD